jgi:ribonuclease T1
MKCLSSLICSVLIGVSAGTWAGSTLAFDSNSRSSGSTFSTDNKLPGEATFTLPELPSCQATVEPKIGTGELPPQARITLSLIARGGPFPYRKDGTTFYNRERRLPQKPRSYYSEYTVPTPREKDRGQRRIVAGLGKTRDVSTSEEYYYTPNHYEEFFRVCKR